MGIGTPKEHEEFRAKLERDGIEKVRDDLTKLIYGNNNWKTRMAEAFIEAEVRKTDDAFREEQLKLAKDANDVARRANLISFCALAVSLVAIIIAVFIKS